jgi:CheY-like chemotaxis protein
MSNSQTVLIVDDNQSFREALTALLTLEGYATLEAADGVEALDTLLRSPDRLVVLLDLRMPWMSGQEVLVLIGTGKDLMRHAYIVMTSDKSALDAAHTALLTRHHIPLLEKPFDVTTLAREVARATQRLAAPRLTPRLTPTRRGGSREAAEGEGKVGRRGR